MPSLLQMYHVHLNKNIVIQKIVQGKNILLVTKFQLPIVTVFLLVTNF